MRKVQMVNTGYIYTALIMSVVAYVPNLAYAADKLDEKHTASEGTGNFPQFDPSSYASQIFWLTIAFFAIYFILAKLAIPKIANVIDVRNTQKTNDLTNAEQLNNEAEEALKQYEDTIAEAHDKVRNILHETKEDILEQHNTKYDNFQKDAQIKLDKTEENIKQAISDAMNDITIYAADLAKFTTQKFGLENISNDDIQKTAKSVWKKEGENL